MEKDTASWQSQLEKRCDTPESVPVLRVGDGVLGESTKRSPALCTPQSIIPQVQALMRKDVTLMISMPEMHVPELGRVHYE